MKRKYSCVKRSYGNEYFSVYINPKIPNQWNPFITISLASPKHCSLFIKRTQVQAPSPFNIHKQPSNSTNIHIFMGGHHLPDVTSLTANKFPSIYWLFHFSCLWPEPPFYLMYCCCYQWVCLWCSQHHTNHVNHIFSHLTLVAITLTWTLALLALSNPSSSTASVHLHLLR